MGKGYWLPETEEDLKDDEPVRCRDCGWDGDMDDVDYYDEGNYGSFAICPNCGKENTIVHLEVVASTPEDCGVEL